MTNAKHTPGPSWPRHPDGTNKTIGEMTEEERRPLLRAAFLRSRLEVVWPDAFATKSEV